MAPKSKTCFVTVGATASFDALLRAVLTPGFVSELHDHGYTQLLIQHGKEDGKQLFDQLSSNSELSKYRPKITGFDIAPDLTPSLVSARDGVCISHAGSGTILAALRCGSPLIVVPNPDLLDNHQVELAEVLAAQGYVVHGKLSNLPTCLPAVEILRKKQTEWPPINSGKHRGAKGLKGIMDEETGFLD